MKPAILDIESYPNYFLIAIRRIGNEKIIRHELRSRSEIFDVDIRKAIYRQVTKNTIVTFNGLVYDFPMLSAALSKYTCEQLNKLSSSVIASNKVDWMIYRDYQLEQIKSDHIDLFGPSPGVRVGLKTFAGRMNFHNLQDLPYPPGTVLTEKEMDEVSDYCDNDLDITENLYNKIKPEIDLRRDMSKEYDLDLVSKSDAQIAEAVIKKELTKVMGKIPKRPTMKGDVRFKYKAPDYIHFENESFKEGLKLATSLDFTLNAAGSVKLPAELSKLKLTLGESTYKLGGGGLHSQEKSRFYIPAADEIMVDFDVASQYPSIILNNDYYPRHLGPSFITVYRNIVERRLEAKRSGDKVTNASLKIVINSAYGKLGSKYSILYDPSMVSQVTLTGQLTLLMLIERLEAKGAKVISANTDGIVVIIKKKDFSIIDGVLFDWEDETGFELEDAEYKALYSRDVNNYLAVKPDDTYKGKGIFTLDTLTKNLQGNISVRAVINKIVHDTPIECTINDCHELTEFIVTRAVAGGAVWRDKEIGKNIRWVYVTDGETIHYKKNGNKVPKSDGAYPVMNLTETPVDIDRNYYINEAYEILEKLGAEDVL